MGSLVPRGDVDVTKINQIISKPATGWIKQRVVCASECYDVSFNGGQLSTRYLSQDGIHLSRSGTKRLMDVINRICRIVEDFDKCTFSRGNNMLRARVTGDNHRRSQAGQFRKAIAAFRQNRIRCNGSGLKGKNKPTVYHYCTLKPLKLIKIHLNSD